MQMEDRAEGWLIKLNYYKDMIGIHIFSISQAHLNRIYKASKQLYDLCWQEIKRRRDNEKAKTINE